MWFFINLFNQPFVSTTNTNRLARLISTERALDTVIWQLIASVAAPGYTIHTIVALTLAGLTAAESLDAVQQGLAVCCLIIDNTLQKYHPPRLQRHPCLSTRRR